MIARTLLLLSIVLLSSGTKAYARQPNIVLIMADDMGYECVGANGGTSYKTPRLDALATGGLRFDYCYSQPICTPSRVKLMTGRYNQKNYDRFGVLDPGETTFAQVLRKAGYKTCIAGKWQLGGGLEAPGHFGFDEYCLWQIDVRKSRYPNPVLEQNGKVLEYSDGEYGPDIVADYLVGFMERNKASPFLVYYPMILPHWPFEPTPDSPDWNPEAEGVLKGQGKKPYFTDMVAYTDKMVGKIVDSIEKLGLREDTVILFTGDNGNAVGLESEWRGEIIRGAKGSTTDGGTHAPFIASWPGTIDKAQVSRDLIDFSDFFPTLLDLAGAKTPQGLDIDGRSFAPQLRGEKGQARDWIHIWYARNGGPTGSEFTRNHDYKLYADGRFYHVAKDRLEKTNLADTGTGDTKLSTEAAASKKLLAAALEKYEGTRRIFPRPKPKAKKSKVRTSFSIDQIESGVKEIGGRSFRKEGELVEIVLNGKEPTDKTFALLASCRHLTDLSLEQTPTKNKHVAMLGELEKLEWLNLYKSDVGNQALKTLSKLPRLKLLPIGSTRVSDKGLGFIREMTQLQYLGLRDNSITDAGIEKLQKLTALKGLHLGGTDISDAAILQISKLPALEQLWVDRTKITDKSISALTKLRSLKELHIESTAISSNGLDKLRKALPNCRVFSSL